jgi:hypothetical protein
MADPKLFTEKVIGVRIVGSASRELEMKCIKELLTQEGSNHLTMLQQLMKGDRIVAQQPLTIGEQIDLLKHFRRVF